VKSVDKWLITANRSFSRLDVAIAMSAVASTLPFEIWGLVSTGWVFPDFFPGCDDISVNQLATNTSERSTMGKTLQMLVFAFSVRTPLIVIGFMTLPFSLVGCARHQPKASISARGLSPSNRCDPEGIPYYLPKPLLVVAKNFRHIDESKVGLSGPAPIPDGFDNQAAYADVKANVTVPNPGDPLAAGTGDGARVATTSATKDLAKSYVAPSLTPGTGNVNGDSLAPDSFFTYQIVFIPDLTQKYGLKITGGAGEMRAAMNMVNGWMYTGMGPFYLKDSSSAQNILAQGVASMFVGRGAADVLNEVGGLTTAIGGLPKNESTTVEQMNGMAEAIHAIAEAASGAKRVPKEMLNYAEIYIYEPFLVDGDHTEWRLVAEHNFSRHYFESDGQPISADKQALLKGVIDQYSRGSLPSPKGLNPTDVPESGSNKTESGGASFDALLKPLDEAARKDQRVPGSQPAAYASGPQPPVYASGPQPPISIDIDNSQHLPARANGAPSSNSKPLLNHFRKPAPVIHTKQGPEEFRQGLQ